MTTKFFNTVLLVACFCLLISTSILAYNLYWARIDTKRALQRIYHVEAVLSLLIQKTDKEEIYDYFPNG